MAWPTMGAILISHTSMTAMEEQDENYEVKEEDEKEEEEEEEEDEEEEDRKLKKRRRSGQSRARFNKWRRSIQIPTPESSD